MHACVYEDHARRSEKIPIPETSGVTRLEFTRISVPTLGFFIHLLFNHTCISPIFASPDVKSRLECTFHFAVSVSDFVRVTSPVLAIEWELRQGNK